MKIFSNASRKKALIYFFEQVAQKNKTQLHKLKQEPSFSIEPERWCFTLPNLYQYLQNQDNAFSNIQYKQFRQLIYNSPINEAVKSHYAEIIIIENQTKVDQSIYALVWQTKN